MNKGSPLTSTLQTFVRKDDLSPDEWLKVLEHLRSRINPFLDTVTLPIIGNIHLFGCRKVLPLSLNSHPIVDDLSNLAKDHKVYQALITQGIFFINPARPIISETGRFSIKLWGLSRSGKWTLGEIIVDGMGKDEPFNHRFYQKALNLELFDQCPIGPHEIVDNSLVYPNLWFSLKKAFDSIIAERKEKYDQLCKLQLSLDSETEALRSIYKNVEALRD